MNQEIAIMIERWFTSHDDEFAQYDRNSPYLVIPPMEHTAHIVFTTKPGVVANALAKSATRSTVGMIGCYGLPTHDDAQWIRNFVGTRELWFLGDMDPADLLIYAWLRIRLAPMAISHLGVSDRYLESLNMQMTPAHRIRLSPSENEALDLVKLALPDFEHLVGSKSAETLQGSQKFELEATMHGPGGIAALLAPLTQSS